MNCDEQLFKLWFLYCFTHHYLCIKIALAGSLCFIWCMEVNMNGCLIFLKVFLLQKISMFIMNGRDNIKNYMSLGEVWVFCRVICLEALMLLPSGWIVCGWRGWLRLVNLNRICLWDPHLPLWHRFSLAVCSLAIALDGLWADWGGSRDISHRLFPVYNVLSTGG